MMRGILKMVFIASVEATSDDVNSGHFFAEEVDGKSLETTLVTR